jgi:hypothetical protein
MSECLFCVHISGMDELIPMRTMGEAVRAAAFLNAEYMEAYKTVEEKHGNAGVTPHCFAAPSVWTYDKNSHIKILESMLARAKNEKCPHWLCT